MRPPPAVRPGKSRPAGDQRERRRSPVCEHRVRSESKPGEGLRFHDGTPVLARDVIASLRRWAGRDIYARSSFERVDELKALDDATMQFRLKRPFRLLADLFAKLSPYPPTIMPERLAN